MCEGFRVSVGLSECECSESLFSPVSVPRVTFWATHLVPWSSPPLLAVAPTSISSPPGVALPPPNHHPPPRRQSLVEQRGPALLSSHAPWADPEAPGRVGPGLLS